MGFHKVKYCNESLSIVLRARKKFKISASTPSSIKRQDFLVITDVI